MRIDRLYVKNFKGFDESTFEFRPNFNLIVGRNGTGKTSLLDALSIAVGSWFLGISGHNSRGIQTSEPRKITRFIDQKFEQIQQFPVVISASGSVKNEQIDWTRTQEGLGRKTTYKNALKIKAIAEDTSNQVMTGEQVTLPVISYYGAGRLWQEPRDITNAPVLLKKYVRAPQDFAKEKDDDDSEFFGSRFVGYRFSVDPRCSPRDLIKWMRHERRIELDEEIHSTAFRLVLSAIKTCLPESERVRYSIRHHSLMFNMLGNNIVSFDDLSDGYRNMVAMVGDLAYKISQLNPHLGGKALADTPGVVLIDELDLHLHPKWQLRVIEDLRRTFPKIQFIATTHSPFLIQTVRPGELIMLDGEPTTGYSGRGIEEVIRYIMGVDMPEMSPRFAEMKDVAKRYFEILEQGRGGDEKQKQELKIKLEAMTAPYVDNPAYVAFLEQKRSAAGID